MKKSTVRYIQKFTVERSGEEIIFTVTGNGFLHHMVRIMVGTLLEVGRGERTADSVASLFGEGKFYLHPYKQPAYLPQLCDLEVGFCYARKTISKAEHRTR